MFSELSNSRVANEKSSLVAVVAEHSSQVQLSASKQTGLRGPEQTTESVQRQPPSEAPEAQLQPEALVYLPHSSVIPRSSCCSGTECTNISTSVDCESESRFGSPLRSPRPRQSLGVLLPVLFEGLRSPGVLAGWYVVAMASAQEVLNGLMWATFGPIARTSVRFLLLEYL